MAIKTLSHAASNVGRVRASNQDSGYAGYNFFFVADGMGGHAGGDIASAIVSQSVAHADTVYETPEAAATSMIDGLHAANRKLAETVAEHSELAGMGTTFSGIMITEDQVTVAHIGDSRIYLARDGKVSQITVDHTFVQRLVDTGRITAEEALVHPRRSVLMRVLGDVEVAPEIDTETFSTKPGDRWLLCSDGLSGYVPENILEDLLLSKSVDAEEATALLVYETLEHGAPDNVTVVVVDIVDAALPTDFVPEPTFVGSAANEVVIENRKGASFVRIFNPRTLFDLFNPQPAEAEYAPESEEYLEKILNQTRAKVRWRRIRQLATILVLIALAIFIAVGSYNYTQTRYYIAESDGYVAIYQGIKESFGSLKFSSVYRMTDVKVDDLNEYQKQLVERSVSADSISDVKLKLDALLKAGK